MCLCVLSFINGKPTTSRCHECAVGQDLDLKPVLLLFLFEDSSFQFYDIVTVAINDFHTTVLNVNRS